MTEERWSQAITGAMWHLTGGPAVDSGIVLRARCSSRVLVFRDGKPRAAVTTPPPVCKRCLRITANALGGDA